MKLEIEGQEMHVFTYQEVYKLLLLAYNAGASDGVNCPFVGKTVDEVKKFMEPRLNKILNEAERD